jgi:hypothetical protein
MPIPMSLSGGRAGGPPRPLGVVEPEEIAVFIPSRALSCTPSPRPHTPRDPDLAFRR